MSSLIIQLLKNEILTYENYVTWMSSMNMILVNDDLCFVLMEECLPFSARNASQNVRDAYNSLTVINKMLLL